ncbi:MAG: ribosome maturation factor RimP [Burkholderiales bacterium]|nr:ribosome maturation factor RimP [Burkholderiales bacterium]
MQAVERTVAGLGYDVVECERTGGGLLRVYIDRRAGQDYDTGPGDFILVEDCEKVTRQLQYVLEVEGCDYARLEVSSPGLDRPLHKPADYARFAGEQVDITLKLPFQGRKKWRGLLQAAEAPADQAAEPGAAPDAQAWQLLIDDGKQQQVLGFTLDEVREARLVPVVDFKGRARKAPAAAAPAAADNEQDSGGHKE